MILVNDDLRRRQKGADAVNRIWTALTPGAERALPDGAVTLAMAGHPTRLLPRVVMSTLVGAMLAATMGAPSSGQAQPGGVPDPGARPAPAGQLPLPGGGSTVTTQPANPATVMGPLAADIAAKEIEINTITQQLQALEPQLAPAGTAAELAEQELFTRNEALTQAEQALDEVVGESYRGAAALPPELFLPELAGINAHAPSLPVDVPTGAEAAALEYVRARDEALVAQEQYDLATGTEQTLEEQAAELEDRLERLQDQLDDLLDENLDLLVAEQRQQEQQQQQNAGDHVSTQPVNGFAPHPNAVRAVRFALGELGKPYVWGAEGPNAYDCSGLVLRSYQSVGANLPRVAADQFWGTRDRLVTMSATVAQQGLLPGDLVFFGRGSWQSVHHVGMYVGNGLMVHAPNSREVVKVSPIWWYEFYAATRVFPASAVQGNPNDPGGSDPNPSDPEPGPPPTTNRPPTTRPPQTTEPPTSEPPTTNPPPTTNSPSPPPPATTTVPNLDGMSQNEAEAAINAADLTPVTGEPVVDASCTAGAVVQQSPAAGAEVEVGSNVTFRICQTPTTEDPPASESPTAPESPSETPNGGSNTPEPPPS
jgi:peptidoglycan DL-endopeptidase CwlO